MPVLTSAKRHSLERDGSLIDAVAEFQIVGRRHRFEYLEQMARDRHLAHRIGDLAVLDPEAGCAATVVAGYAIDAGADQVGDVEPLLDVRDQFGRCRLAGLEVEIIRSGRGRRRYAAMGVAGGDQPEFARGGAVQQPRRQHALIDNGELPDLDALGVEGLRAQAANAQGIVDDAYVLRKQLLAETV